ncbi:hypothetical protein J2X19_001787 [Rhodoferax ferrireducens]|uniref:Uncharacterized protein n=1 Tax=Rhodoferax ferrireducens TaxID=192843 RepID=A0ABU2C709_9BURK|nr:hypothetical protein [Rhodoferax ferrireducens]MDR7377129.1 hypothetical protein [Rhodoferax ferrireducens]
MDSVRFLAVVEDLAINGGDVSLDEALEQLGDYIENLDSTRDDYVDSVVMLMRVAAAIWKQQRFPYQASVVPNRAPIEK